MTTRLATVADIPFLLDIGERFFAYSPYQGLAKYDPETVGTFLKWMMDSSDACVIRHDTGAIGGLLTPIYFSKDTKVATELFWWADSNGAALSKAFEAWGKDVGATVITMACLNGPGINSAAFDRLYRMGGYRKIETAYMRAL